MLTPLDYIVIVVYLVAVTVFGLRAGGKQTSTEDYFLGNRKLPWWASCFSLVATETSTLTVIGVPTIAYLGSLTFLQLTFGYLIGRIIVSLILLPRYYAGNMATTYTYLGERFGTAMRSSASVVFMVTRLLADGVRLFATAIPIMVIAQSAGFSVTYWEIILGIGIVTIIYTYAGGIKAVVWMDVVQMSVYLAGAFVALVLLMNHLPDGGWKVLADAGKTRLFYSGSDLQGGAWFTEPYTMITAVLAGTLISMASHGTDQVFVQRLLTCRNTKDSQKALVMSGVIVIVQFSLFLVIGLLLWSYYDGATLVQLGLTRGDEIFPKYIIEGMPAGISGLILAGILAAAMSTLSSSLNALASSSVIDLYERFRGKLIDPIRGLRISRLFTLFWGGVFMIFATLFVDQQSPVLELGLSVATFTYGGLLGSFLLGLMNPHVGEKDALIGFFVAIVAMVLIIFGLWYSTAEARWIFMLIPSEVTQTTRELKALAWPWYTPLGVTLCLVTGSTAAWIRRYFVSNQQTDHD